MEFSKQTRYFLKKWGWTEETNIDITPYVKILEEYGYEVFDSVKEFLRHFGGFNFVPYAKNGSPYGKYNWWKNSINRYKWNLTASYMHFDIAETNYSINDDYTWMNWYEPRVGEKLIPVGQCSWAHITLLMGESGKMYGIYDDYMWLFGNDYVEAIESIYNRTFLKEIPLTHKQQLVEDALKNARRKFRENEVKVHDVTCESTPNDPNLCILIELSKYVYDKYENEGIIEQIKKIIMKSLEENHYLEEFNEEVDFSFWKSNYY